MKTQTISDNATALAEFAEQMRETEVKNERDFLRIASISTALAFGTMLGSIASLKKDDYGFSFQFSGVTVVAFVIGAVVGFLYWKLALAGTTRNGMRRRHMAMVLLLLGGVGAFLYPLRFVPAEKFAEISEGLVTDVIALSLVGLILWRVKIFFEENSEAAPTGTDTKGREPTGKRFERYF